MTACDASPYAATIGNQEISVNQLNHQLAEYASNKAYVTSFDQSQAENAQAAQQQGETAPAYTVAGNGGAGTYSTGFAAYVLQRDIQVDAVHQSLASGKSKFQPATADESIAARAIYEYSAPYFGSLAPDIQQILVEQLADLGAITKAPSPLSSVQQDFAEIQGNVFSSVCVKEASAFTKQAAQLIVSSGAVNGTQVCYDQQDLQAQPAAVQKAVMALTSDGQVSGVITTSYGFEVLQLVNRQTPGLSTGVAQVISAATSSDSLTAANTILERAHVKINPAYGTYSSQTGQVTPPVQPGQ
jgi:parvulin-like peptidyl-prolyl isomerase